jgi:hypothetical protein
MIRVETRTLMPMWRSKEDIYKFFTEQKQYFLPSKRGCSIRKETYDAKLYIII